VVVLVLKEVESSSDAVANSFEEGGAGMDEVERGGWTPMRRPGVVLRVSCIGRRMAANGIRAPRR